MENNSTKEAQSITKENENVSQISSALDENNIDESEATHLTSLKKQAFKADKYKQQCITEDTNENELSNDGIVLTTECTKQESFLRNLNRVNSNESHFTAERSSMAHDSAQFFDKFQTSSFTSTVNIHMEQKPYKLNPTEDAQSITKENKRTSKLRQAVDEQDIDEADAHHLTSLKEKASEADKHEQRCIIEDIDKNELNNDGKVLKPECTKHESFLRNLNRLNCNESYATMESMPHNSALLLDKFQTGSLTSTINIHMEQKPYKINPTKDAQSITEENERTSKLRQVVDEQIIDKSDAHHLTSLKEKTFEHDKHEQQCIIQDIDKNELNNDGKVLTPECNKNESFSRNSNRVNCNESYGTVERQPHNSALLFDKSETYFFTSTVNIHMEQKQYKINRTKDAQSITKENERTSKLRQAVDTEDLDKSDAHHLTSLTQKTFEGDKHEQQCIIEDIDKNELNNDGKVLTLECTKHESFSRNLNRVNFNESYGTVESMPHNSAMVFDKSETSSFTSTVNIHMEQKPYKINPTKDAQSITKENKRTSKLRQAVDEQDLDISDAHHLISLKEKASEADKHEQRCIFEDKEKNELNNDVKVLTPECTKQESFSGNLNRVNSNESHVTGDRSSMPHNNVASEDSQLVEATFLLLGSDDHVMYENDEIKTLEDALRYFGLYSLLEDLDKSLEDVRRHRIAEKNHDEYFRQIDREILKLSLIYHPDKNRRGTENRLKTAEKRQTIVNAVRNVLSYLNEAFLADICTDHKFQFYSKLNIISLCNEKEVKCRIYEMRFKLSMVSRIKQQNIILQIRKFLIESKMCVSSYIQGKKDEFKNLCTSVFFQLNQCIEGFRRLCEELEYMEKKCKFRKEEHMLSFVQNMAKDIKRDLKVLDFLEKSATSSMQGNYRFLSTGDFIDPYFVRPLVWYINVIVMCKFMSKKVSVWETFTFSIYNYPIIYCPLFKEFSELKPLFYLTAYYSGGITYEKEVQMILNNAFFSMLDESWLKRGKSNIGESKTQIKLKFREILSHINEDAKIKFNADHYTEVMTDDFLALEIEKCMSMMNEFEEQKQELSENIQEIWKKTGKMEGNYDNILQTSEDVNSKIEEIAVTNSKIEAQLQANSSKIDDLLEKTKKLLENSQ